MMHNAIYVTEELFLLWNVNIDLNEKILILLKDRK